MTNYNKRLDEGYHKICVPVESHALECLRKCEKQVEITWNNVKGGSMTPQARIERIIAQVLHKDFVGKPIDIQRVAKEILEVIEGQPKAWAAAL